VLLADVVAGAFFAADAVVGLAAAADFADVDFEEVDFAALDLVAVDFADVDFADVDFADADFAVVVLAVDFAADVLEVRRPAAGLFAGPLARLSASSCTARAKSISSTDSPRGIVAFVSPSVT
jgi:hypothetical protein